MLYVIGAGGHGRLLLDTWRSAGHPEPAGFLDDDEKKHGQTVDALPVLGGINRAAANDEVIVGVGAVNHPRNRVALIESLQQRGCSFPPLVHPRATVARDVKLPQGVVILAGVVVNRGVSLGAFTTVYTGSVIEHDCSIGENTQIAPGVIMGGTVTIGRRCFIGLGAKIIHGLRIGDDSVIGAGSLVIRDVVAGAKVAGAPARQIPS